MIEDLNFLASPEVRKISTPANGTHLWGVVGKAKLIDKAVFAETATAATPDDVQPDAEPPKKGGLQRKGGGLQARLSGLQVGPSGKLRFGTGRVKSRSF